MQAAWSKLDMINLAMNALGKKSVNDVGDSGEFADSASRAFDVLYPYEISHYDWRFATKIQVLSLTLDTPLDPFYIYAYNLPSDYLANRRLLPLCGFQIYEKQLWSNCNNLRMEYRFLPDPTQCPAYFANYFSLVLAQRFSLTVAVDSNLAKNLQPMTLVAKATAMFIDGQSRPSTPLFRNPVTDCRYDYYVGAYRGGYY